MKRIQLLIFPFLFVLGLLMPDPEVLLAPELPGPPGTAIQKSGRETWRSLGDKFFIEGDDEKALYCFRRLYDNEGVSSVNGLVALGRVATLLNQLDHPRESLEVSEILAATGSYFQPKSHVVATSLWMLGQNDEARLALGEQADEGTSSWDELHWHLISAAILSAEDEEAGHIEMRATWSRFTEHPEEFSVAVPSFVRNSEHPGSYGSWSSWKERVDTLPPKLLDLMRLAGCEVDLPESYR